MSINVSPVSLKCNPLIGLSPGFQVNASPSLSSTTANDRIMKQALIDNIIKVVLPPDGIPE